MNRKSSTKKTLTLAQIKNKLLWHLTRRDHSVKELQTKLRHYYEYSEEDFKTAISWLDGYGYLIDEKVLIERLVKKLRTEGKSNLYISTKLKQRGLKPLSLGDFSKEPEVRSENNPMSELDAAQVFLNKKLRGKSLSELNFKETQSLKRKLIARGFSFEIVRSLFIDESRRN